MGAIHWSWKHLKSERLFGSMAFETERDFDSERNAREAVDRMLREQECDKCGCTDLKGDNILVEVHQVELFRQRESHGFFGGIKTVEEKWKTVHRVGNVIFPTAHLFNGGGHFKCRQCGNRMGAPGFFGQWAANIARGG